MVLAGNAALVRRLTRWITAGCVCSTLVAGFALHHAEDAGATTTAKVAPTCGSVGPLQACVSSWSSGITIDFSTAAGPPYSAGSALVEIGGPETYPPSSAVAYEEPVYWNNAGSLYVPLPTGSYSVGVTIFYGSNETTNNGVLTQATSGAPGSVAPPSICSTVTTGEFESPTVPSSGPIAAGIAATQVNGCSGYWIASPDGQVANVGGSPALGPLTGFTLNGSIVDMAATHDFEGYYLLGSDGGIFTFGDATFYGSTGAMHLNQPVVGMAATPDGKGYWLVAADGGV